MTDRLIIGSRGSRLALIQANSIADQLRTHHPELSVEIEIVKTSGDKDQSAPFAQLGATGIFAKELEAALLAQRIDLAVHSLKDLQTQLPDPLTLGTVTKRKWVCDTLISRSGATFDELRKGAVVGTSSARRRGLLLAERSDLVVRECRGNVQTRLAKLERGDYDAILLAEAGLRRLGLADKITEVLSAERFVPAVGQGALGLEIRAADTRVAHLIEPLNHTPSDLACAEERQFLLQIGGGCHAPIGAHLAFEGDEAHFRAFVGADDGSWFVKQNFPLHETEVEGVGARAAREFLTSPSAGPFLAQR